MAEALEQIKRQFGRQAVILNTRTVTRGGLWSLGGKSYVEITAARTMSDLPATPGCGRLTHSTDGPRRAEGAARTMSPPPQVADQKNADALLAEVSSLRSLIGDLVRETRQVSTANLPEELRGTYRQLIENAVGEEIAQQLVASAREKLDPSQLRDPEKLRRHIARAIEGMLPVAGPIAALRTGGPTTIALVGPTGVGKTTTIAKLAANLCLREHRKVGLITIDTYRIAAVDQLRTYAEIIDVPLSVVTTPNELKDALAGMRQLDVVLIDTAGRSQRDQAKIEELRQFFDVIRPDEVHLVLSSTCGPAVLAQTTERFRGVGFDRVIFTKLDEAVGFGVILTCLEKVGAQLSYVTTGQDVPDDIHVGERRALARLILAARPRGSQPTAPEQPAGSNGPAHDRNSQG